MISPLIYRRIRERAGKSGKSVPDNYESILHLYKTVEQRGVNRIIFSWLLDNGSSILNASSMIPGVVVFNAEWAATVILYDTEDTMNAFLITLGHELTQKEKEINWLKYSGNNRNFVAQTNEVHADFGVAQKTCSSSRKALLQSIEYKRQLKKNDEGDFAHPPWWKRYEYANNYNFGETLIRRIADDTACLDEDLISYVVSFYAEIELE